METIRIKPHFSTVVHDADTVELRQGVWNSISHMLHDENQEGSLAKIILALHQGTTPAFIAGSLSIARSKIEAVLDYLQHLGVLQSKSESFVDYYVETMVPTFRRPGQFTYDIAMPLVLVGDSCINQKLAEQLRTFLDIKIDHSPLWNVVKNANDDWLFDAMEQERFISQFESWRNKFLVFTSKHIHPIHATRLNRIARLLQISWLHLALDGPFIFVGPVFHSNHGACFDCFETRIHMNLRESESYQRYKNMIAANQVYTQENDPLLIITSNLLISHAAFEIVNYLTTQCAFTSNKVLTIFLPTMEFVYHQVLRLPSCRTCGSVAERDDTQLYFDFQKLIEEVV